MGREVLMCTVPCGGTGGDDTTFEAYVLAPR